MKYALDQYAFDDSNRCDPLEYAFEDRESLVIEVGKELIGRLTSHYYFFEGCSEFAIENLPLDLPKLKSGEPYCAGLQNQSQTLTHKLRFRR